MGHQRLRLRGGRAQGRASTSPEATAQGGPAPEGEAGLPRACGPHSAPTRQMQLLLPIWEVEPRAQEAQSGCGPDVRTPGVCALRPAEDTRTARAATAEADLRYRRPGSSPAGARGRLRCGRTGREGTAERERAPFTGPFPERRCRPPGTRQPGLAAGRPGPFLRGTQCWLHKGPTPVWTCEADARTCYRAQLAWCPEDLLKAHRAHCFFSSGHLTQRNRQVLEVRVWGTPRGVLWGDVVQIL